MATLPVQNYPSPSIAISALLNGEQTVTLDNAGGSSDMAAVSFVAPKNPFGGTMSLSAFRCYFTTATDTPEVTAYLYSDNSGVPGSLETNGTGVESSAISTNSWVELTWGGTLPTLTEGTQYWILLKCTTGTSVIVKFTYGVLAGTLGFDIGSNLTGSAAGWRACFDASTDNGSTWAGTDRAQVVGFRIKITDGTDIAYWGLPVNGSYASMSGVAGSRINGTQEAGWGITTPADTLIRIKSVALLVRKNGTPGNLVLKIYSGTSTSALATSNAIPAGNLSTSAGSYIFDFSTPVALAGATVYRFVLDAASGDASNYYYMYSMTLDSDAASISLSPWGMFHCVLDGTWDADTTTLLTTMTLILDSTDPFTAPDFPDVGNVTEDDTVNGATGTYHEATEAEVQSGVGFGENSSLTGTYEGGGGGRPEIRGGNL